MLEEKRIIGGNADRTCTMNGVCVCVCCVCVCVCVCVCDLTFAELYAGTFEA